MIIIMLLMPKCNNEIPTVKEVSTICREKSEDVMILFGFFFQNSTTDERNQGKQVFK